jgi:hypothetical protein
MLQNIRKGVKATQILFEVVCPTDINDKMLGKAPSLLVLLFMSSVRVKTSYCYKINQKSHKSLSQVLTNNHMHVNIYQQV